MDAAAAACRRLPTIISPLASADPDLPACTLHSIPIHSTPVPPSTQGAEGEDTGRGEGEVEVAVRCLQYGAWMDVVDSDHKPVFALLEVNLPVIDQAAKRRVCSQLQAEYAASAAGEGLPLPADPAARPELGRAGPPPPPDLTLSSDRVKLHPRHMPTQVCGRAGLPCPNPHAG